MDMTAHRVGPPIIFRQGSLTDRVEADYGVKAKVMVKVLDFVQLGEPDLTVDGTIFELFLT